MISIDNNTYKLTDKGRFGSIALITGVAGLALSAIGLLTNPQDFFSSYLTSFAFWVTLALGSLFFTLLHHVSGAIWSNVVRRASEAMTLTFPLLLVLFIPLLFGAHDLFHWTHSDAVAGDRLLQWKEPYLNLEFFTARAIVFFAVWIVLGWLLNKYSLAQDRDGDPAHTATLRKISAVGIILYAITATFAAFDWLMSLDPHWYSTIFGVYIFTGGFLAALAGMTLFFMMLTGGGILKDVVTTEHFHDLGRFLFAFTAFWAYIAGSQYYLIWFANIPEETIWFLHRWEHGWDKVSKALIVLHFFVPFITLAFFSAKRSRAVMRFIATLLLIMHYVDMFWLVMPTFSPEGVHVSWMHLTTFAGIGGVVLWMFYSRFSANPVVAFNDPKFKDSVAHRV